jgi:hypothetical protein
MDRMNEPVELEMNRFCLEAKTRGARAVMLFGSRAKGEHTGESDADICLIADDLPDEIFKRRYLAPSGYQRLSVFGFRPGEFLRLLEQGNTFVLDIMHDATILYDDGFWDKSQQIYYETIKCYKLQRIKGGWNWQRDLVPPRNRSACS